MTCTPSFSSILAQPILLSSSKRAFSSTSTATSLPFWRASSSACHHRRVAPHPVQGLLDRQHIRVARCLLQEVDHRLERIVRVVDQDILVADGGKDVAVARIAPEQWRDRLP